MGLLRFIFRVAVVGWAVTSAYWLIARYGRQGPMPYSVRWMLDWAPRRLFFPARPVLERSHIAAGGTVLELGPGTGYFSIEAASMVGESGRLLCLDVQRPMLGDLSARLREAGVTNADLLLAHGSWLPLRDGCLDSAFLVAVLGQISDRVAAVAELKRALKPGGVLSVTEYLSDPDYLFEGAGRDLCRAFGFEPMEHIRGLLGYTMNFAAP
jgi:SAM-dependent methyltransferase